MAEGFAPSALRPWCRNPFPRKPKQVQRSFLTLRAIALNNYAEKRNQKGAARPNQSLPPDHPTGKSFFFPRSKVDSQKTRAGPQDILSQTQLILWGLDANASQMRAQRVADRLTARLCFSLL